MVLPNYRMFATLVPINGGEHPQDHHQGVRDGVSTIITTIAVTGGEADRILLLALGRGLPPVLGRVLPPAPLHGRLQVRARI